MSKELTTTTSNLPAVDSATALDTSDIILPLLTVRQNTYKNAALKKFKPGDVILRPDMVAVATEEKGFEIVPLTIEKIALIYRKVSGGKEFVGVEPYDASKPWEFTQGPDTFKRVNSFIVYCLSYDKLLDHSKVKGGVSDYDDMPLPIKIVFNSKGFNAGKALNTHFELSKTFKAVPYTKVFTLKTLPFSNDDGNWFDFGIENALEGNKNKKVPVEMRPVCEFWYNTMANSKTKFKVEQDDDDVVEVSGISTAKTTEVEQDLPF